MGRILEIDGLSKSYDGGKFTLSNCSLSLDAGKICAVVGESGSGKTTLLRLIAGLERPDKGEIKIRGEAVSNDSHVVPPQQRNVGFVFQDFALFPHLTVEQNIAFGLKADKKETVNKLLGLIKMQEYASSYPNTLSGGEEQRVALIRTLARKPELLLLDEPFSNLDAGLKSGLRREIRRIVKDLGTSMIFITHDLSDAIDIADEIIFLKEGIILRHRSVDDFCREIQNEEVGEIISGLKSDAEKILKLVE